MLEYFEEVGHRLQARGSGPLFIISSVNYDNYLARLKTHVKANKRKKKGTRGADFREEEDEKTLKDDAKKSIGQRPENHVTFTSADKGERGGPRARDNTGQVVNGARDSAFADITTTVTREQGNEKSDDKLWRDSSREDEGDAGEKEAARADDVRGRGEVRGEAAANRVIPPRPKEMGQRPQRGDIDIVIISQKYGVVLVEVGALADGGLVIRTCVCVLACVV